MAATSIDLIDLVWTGNLVAWLKKALNEKVAFDYTMLLNQLVHVRQSAGKKYRDSDGAFAVASVDPGTESQRRFTDALTRRGIAVERVDFRFAYVSRPVESDVIYSPQSVAPSMAYLLGMMAERRTARIKPEVLIVTGSFDLYSPLLDFVQNCHGRAGIVYFQPLLDPRWFQVGLDSGQCPIEFFDLMPASEELLGINLSDALVARQSRDKVGAYSAFRMKSVS